MALVRCAWKDFFVETTNFEFEPTSSLNRNWKRFCKIMKKYTSSKNTKITLRPKTKYSQRGWLNKMRSSNDASKFGRILGDTNISYSYGVLPTAFLQYRLTLLDDCLSCSQWSGAEMSQLSKSERKNERKLTGRRYKERLWHGQKCKCR